MASNAAIPLETQATIFRELLNNSKEDRAISEEAVQYFAALELIHPQAESVRCYGLRWKVQGNGQARCAGLLNSPILAAKMIQLWAILRDADIQGYRLREEFYALGPAFHCSSHAIATNYGRFAQRCLTACLRFRDAYGIGLVPTPSSTVYPPDYVPPALLPYADEVQAPTPPASTVESPPSYLSPQSPPTPPRSPDDSDAATLQVAYEEMVHVQQNPQQALTEAWMQALQVADYILKQAGVTVHPPVLLQTVRKLEQGASFVQLGPLEQSTLLFALGRAKGCFEHGI